SPEISTRSTAASPPSSRPLKKAHLDLFERPAKTLGAKVGDGSERRAVLAPDGAAGGLGLITEGGLPAGVLARAAHHDHRQILGRLHDGEHGIRCGRHLPALHVVALVLLAELCQGKARVLEHELLHLPLAVAVARNGGGVLGPEREKGMTGGEEVVAPGLPHGPRDDLEDAEARVAVVVLDIVRSLAADGGHRAHVGGKAVLDVERLPGILCLVLRDAVRHLGGAALGGPVSRAGEPAPHIHQEQAHGAADGHVGAEALAEGVVARVDLELARDGAVDDHERRDGMRGRVDGVAVEVGSGEGVDRGDDHGQVLGSGAGHDGIDGDALHGRLALARGQDGHHLARIAIGPAEALAHGLVRGRDDGQPVRPAALLIEAVDGRVGAVQPERLGRGARRAHDLVTARTTVSMARSAFFTTSSSWMPPRGCGMSARGSSASPRFLASSVASDSNSLVPITTVGMPCCSSTMAPWILHDVHDPQSALPTRTKSHVVRSARIDGDGGPAIPFSRLMPSRTPYRSFSRPTTASMRVPALALLLSRMPARLPWRLARRGARPVARIFGPARGP